MHAVDALQTAGPPYTASCTASVLCAAGPGFLMRALPHITLMQ